MVTHRCEVLAKRQLRRTDGDDDTTRYTHKRIRKEIKIKTDGRKTLATDSEMYLVRTRQHFVR